LRLKPETGRVRKVRRPEKAEEGAVVRKRENAGGIVMIIRPSSDIRQNYEEIAFLCRETSEPVFLTENGKNDLVVMDISLFERMERMLHPGEAREDRPQEREKEETAYLSSKGRYVVFSYRDRVIRFMGPYSLIRIEKVKVWDKGYIVVDVRYSTEPELVEDYIDFVPILERLYIDPGEFLSPIRNVEIRYPSEPDNQQPEF
jgi:PHD/YefM family antitoxin component YafN of YafNO toxin-antitoxin module